jgi:hypothetical protein
LVIYAFDNIMNVLVSAGQIICLQELTTYVTLIRDQGPVSPIV